jgi:UDP-N-acetylmuramyl pentapeptide phosphotransferase/UDP-N-acetylglucosamine-1-phosphate transferase
MDRFWLAALVPAAALAASLGLTGAVGRWLGGRAILDHPVARSSHSAPVPRGGGLAVVPVLLAAWAALAAAGEAAAPWPVVAAAGCLALVSWRDDLGGLPAGLRLAVHAAACGVGIACLEGGPVFQGWLPPLLDHAAAAILWVWFVNLYNFMDGIDGIAGTETACLGAGVALVAAVAGTGGGAAALAAAAAALGFLWWNRPPARIFLGDVGSVPLGYLMGWLLLALAARGLWAPALVLPLYYLADATITLARRALRGAAVWRAHREHFYQRALGPGESHAAVLRLVLAADLLLVGLAGLAVSRPWTALLLAAAVTAALLARLARRAKRVR